MGWCSWLIDLEGALSFRGRAARALPCVAEHGEQVCLTRPRSRTDWRTYDLQGATVRELVGYTSSTRRGRRRVSWARTPRVGASSSIGVEEILPLSVRADLIRGTSFAISKIERGLQRLGAIPRNIARHIGTGLHATQRNPDWQQIDRSDTEESRLAAEQRPEPIHNDRYAGKQVSAQPATTDTTSARRNF